MSFGLILKELREESQLLQKDLAEILNVTPAAVGMYEQDRREPDFATLISLADYFQVTTDYLLGIEVPSRSSNSIESDIREIKSLLQAKNPNERIGESIIELMRSFGEISPSERVSDEQIEKILKIFEVALEIRQLGRGNDE